MSPADYDAKSDKEAASYNRFIECLDAHDEQDLSDIKTESKLLREIKDIQDELMMMSEIFKDQKEVMASFSSHLQGLNNSDYTKVNNLVDKTVAYLEKANMMQEQAKTTYTSVNLHAPYQLCIDI